MKTKQIGLIALLAIIITIALIACKEDDPPTPETFTVTFNSNGGSAVPNQTIEKGKTVTEPQGVTKANNTLDGWYKESALSTQWIFATDTVTAPITLYAKWSETKKKPDDTQRSLSFPTTENPNNAFTVTISSNDQFTAAEWTTLCDDFKSAIETAYGNGVGAIKNRFRSGFGQEGGVTTVLEKNPTDYTNYKVGADFKTLYLNVNNIASINYVDVIQAIFIKDPNEPIMKG